MNSSVIIAKKSLSQVYFLITRSKHKILKVGLNQEWRKQRDLPENPNRGGPLANLPDYTFLDGRPTPLGMNRLRKITKQREIAKQIVTLSSEIDFALERSAKLKQQEETKRQEIINSKLKPKGNTLLQ
ncbi:39S ribosomal protein L52, mitochondrial-like [Ctenocephalides felis]|uniref:39S ribosomal protein L52, mitochondrial-like n=1 Tax=Ctenocephalides felis TaxID=7515 RepID=UPI000E6E1A28|nr:39S ribosomal protein L52, mitochondrial-like [Ctenocephalides felis]